MSEVEPLKTAIQGRWSGEPSVKAKKYIHAFFNATRTGKKIAAQVEGNDGTYTVSIQVDQHRLSSACSCYIGKRGFCHHCEALAFAFLKHSAHFKEIKTKTLADIHEVKGFCCVNF